jgi:hypothetical protein
MTIVVWIIATWVLTSLIAGPLIGTVIGYGLGGEPAPQNAENPFAAKVLPMSPV